MNVNELTSQELEQHQIKVCDYADELLDKALASGEAFSEGLCNWAVNQAEQKFGS